jgi:hypothetical protein
MNKSGKSEIQWFTSGGERKMSDYKIMTPSCWLVLGAWRWTDQLDQQLVPRKG